MKQALLVAVYKTYCTNYNSVKIRQQFTVYSLRSGLKKNF